MKEKILAFTVADDKNLPHAKMLENSFKKFHPDIDFHIVCGEELNELLKEDPAFFYRQKPKYMMRKIAFYDLIIGLDADQIITGPLDEIIEDKSYDVATVYNWNRVDPQVYGAIGLATIQPQEYYNCGLVAVRSLTFLEDWSDLCNSKHFDRMPFREQGFLNILAHYGNFNVKCLDETDGWYGLRSKGEWSRCKMENGKLVLEPDNGYPAFKKEIRVIHWGGGAEGVKMNYRAFFEEDVISYLDSLVN